MIRIRNGNISQARLRSSELNSLTSVRADGALRRVVALLLYPVFGLMCVRVCVCERDIDSMREHGSCVAGPSGKPGVFFCLRRFDVFIVCML